MGYAIMSARKILLTNRINRLNFQIMCLGEAQNSLSQQMGNYQRMISYYNNQNSFAQSLAMLCGITNMMSGQGGYNFNFTGESFLPLFGQYATVAMVEDDIEAQKKQLETQLQVATKELEAVEKAEEQAIGRATPKYA